MAIQILNNFKNINEIKRSLFAILKNTSIFVKVVCFLVIIGFALCVQHVNPYIRGVLIPNLTVIPRDILPPTFQLWTAFTHCFLEKDICLLLIDLLTLGLCGKLIEPLWGTFEMILFFLLVNVSVAFLSALSYFIVYMFISNPYFLFNQHIYGMAGYVAGISVAVKQVMPDHVLIHTKRPFGKFTNQHVPLLLFIFSLVYYCIGLLNAVYPLMVYSYIGQVDEVYPLMVGWGIVISWVYLRFYQVHSNGSRGDMAESFKFSSFFPTVLQPPIELIGNHVFKILVIIRICRKTVRKYDVGAPTSISISLPGMDPNDAERRRQKAIKLLSERLNQQDESEAWPLMEENQKTENKNSNEDIILIHTSSDASEIVESISTSTVSDSTAMNAENV